METKVQRVSQKNSTRYVLSIPKPLVEIMELEGTNLEWNFISKDRVELKVKRENGHGKKSGSSG